MNRNRKEQIREKARGLLRKVWSFREEWLSSDISEEQVLRAAPDVIVTKILGFRLEKTEEIFTDSTDPGFKTAGTVDREQRVIRIAKNSKFESQRYSLAHELGHVFLHPEATYNRDRHADGSDFSVGEKPEVEQEADVFAAELLMPVKLLTTIFVKSFGERIDRREIDQDFAFHLNAETGEGLTAKQLSQLSARELAMRIASVSSFRGNLFTPLDKRFGVSRKAMAIQLTEHGLVV